MTSKSSRQIFAIQFNNDDNEEDIILEEPTCLCGCMRVTRALWVVAVLRLLFDLTALYTAWDTVFMYPSVFSSLTTFTVLCVVISGLHEEKGDKIRYAHIWVVSHFTYSFFSSVIHS
ncbi:unnamed protein product [Anisakis simplex]|uniref:Transmembrane protein 128 n=1 Tax=Anisakis simplex TaxID=6269 RepID=A0A0M3JE93_ANISI|nr:unnamed protein product [Anisakis simplex]